jgi:hypothetical protein
MSQLKRDKLFRRVESASQRLTEACLSECPWVEVQHALDKYLKAKWEFWNYPASCDWNRFPENGVSV